MVRRLRAHAADELEGAHPIQRGIDLMPARAQQLLEHGHVIRVIIGDEDAQAHARS